MNDVYHGGELSVQKRAGVEKIAVQNAATVKPAIMKGAMRFLNAQSLIIAASIDGHGNVWCSALIGEPGFVHVQDDTTLTIDSGLFSSDPLNENLRKNHNIGLLAIDLVRRIRMRLNGTGYFETDKKMIIHAEQVYGNCPKYIQKRSLHPEARYSTIEKSVQRSSYLSLHEINWIKNADTFFIASANLLGKADASHRGGMPGFVRVMNEQTLVFPDYYGNSMFNTLGNIHDNPSTGILFIDFNHGHTLHLSGRSEIIWDDQFIHDFPGAERLVRFEVEQILHIENSTRIGWEFVEYSPANPSLAIKKENERR